MKIPIYMLGLALLTLFAHGRESTLPEPSEPPYEVGARPLESGHIIERKGAPDLNFRIVENRMRLYWLDEDGLVMEPEVPTVIIRFDRTRLPARVRDFHQLKRLSDDAALGSPYILVPPHYYFVTLVLSPTGSEDTESYRFRYTPAMDAVSSTD